MKKVIIAEDIRAILEKEQSFLNRSDVRMLTAKTNEKALALHRDEKADLIIAKLDAAEMSGETLVSLIRRDDELSKVSIIIVSPETEADINRCLECGANSFVTGPVNAAVLLQEAYQLLHIAQRRSCRVRVSIKVHGTSKKIPFTAHAENISASGMMFCSAAVLSEGDSITCSFSLPDSTGMNTSAEIVRVLEEDTPSDVRHYGVKFTDCTPGFISAIEAFVERECVET